MSDGFHLQIMDDILRPVSLDDNIIPIVDFKSITQVRLRSSTFNVSHKYIENMVQGR